MTKAVDWMTATEFARGFKKISKPWCHLNGHHAFIPLIESVNG